MTAMVFGLSIGRRQVFVQQSAGRILRAIFEICLKRGWAVPARALQDGRAANVGFHEAPRQFKGVPQEVLRKAEGKQFVRLRSSMLY